MTGVRFRFLETGIDQARREIFFTYEIHTNSKVFPIKETLTLPVDLPASSVIDDLIRALHLTLGISYYKAFIPPVIEHPYAMASDEAQFWNTVYKNGLGEFMFKNGLAFDSIASFDRQDGIERAMQDDIQWHDGALLGIGGGKDSVVAGELLKELGVGTTGFVLATGEQVGQTQSVADCMGVDLHIVERRLDQSILEINKLDGAYNGHIPISLVFALVGALLAASTGNKYVVVANEASASIPHASWQGHMINHQWSKSLDFERLFQDFLHRQVSPELTYFSAIRPLSSVGVAKVFAKYPAYFELFTSDNSLFKINQSAREHPRWSTDSPKSLSSFILLAPWLSDDDLMRTFGRNFMDLKQLESLFISLLGADNNKVLDCVGTPDELRYSLALLHQSNRFTDSYLMQVAMQNGMIIDPEQSSVPQSILSLEEHALPEALRESLMHLIGDKL